MKKPNSVSDIMSRKLITFQVDTNVLSAIDSLLKYNISGAPVLDENGNLVGILSEIDTMATLIQSSYHGEGGGKVKDYMSTNVVTVNPEMGIVDLAEYFLKKHFRRLPVMDRGKLVGLVSRKDVLLAIQKLSR